MGIRDVLELTLDIAGWLILARKVLSLLHDIHKSDQRIKVGRGIPTPELPGKMVLASHSTKPHPTSVVAFQTTWVKCPVSREKVGFWGLYFPDSSVHPLIPSATV